MIKIITSIIFLLYLPTLLYAQNLVLNPGFENSNHCITESDVSKYSNVPSLLLSQCKNWASFSDEGTADLFQPCNEWSSSIASKKVKAHSGICYAGFYAFDHGCCSDEYREYLVGKLQSPLVKGENYKVSFYVLLMEKSNYATSSIGVYFSQDTVYRNDNFYGVAPFIPQVQNSKGQYLSDKKNWTEFSYTYKALGGEQFFMIGNFMIKSDTLFISGTENRDKQSYYYIDDICVSAKNCNTPVTLPKYGFRVMVSEQGSNLPISDASAEITEVEISSEQTKTKTGADGKARFLLAENEYMFYLKSDCYMPAIGFYKVPLIQNGNKLPEQMNYFSLVPLKKGAKMIIGETLSKTFAESISKSNNQLSRMYLRLDKLAQYIKENPSLKISLNAGINLNYISSEAKKVEIKEKQNVNLLFMQNYLIDRGVKKQQLIIKFLELNSENRSVSGTIDGSYIGAMESRYEIEVLEVDCKGNSDELELKGDFFHKNEVGSVYILDKVFFSPDSPELKKNSYEELDRLVSFLKQNENLKIRINGHTDIGKTNGSDDFLQQLSENRAKAVADYLVSKGAKESNITWQGFANRKPIADNSTEAGKAQNRRVEVEIIGF